MQGFWMDFFTWKGRWDFFEQGSRRMEACGTEDLMGVEKETFWSIKINSEISNI